MNLDELDRLKVDLRKKREIPQWLKERFDVDYDHSIEIVTNLTNPRMPEEETNLPIRPRIKAAKRKLIEMLDEGSRVMDVKMKRMDTRTYSKHKVAMDAYNKMMEDERAAMEEKKAELAARRDARNASKGQA